MTLLIFQSTLPHGSDLYTCSKDRATNISIHAPSRERHTSFNCITFDVSNFNPRSLTGATALWMLKISLMAFQSTLPHGSDNTALKPTLSIIDFNPRSLTGATFPHDKQAPKQNYFNPRSLTGATCRFSQYHRFTGISIHAPSRERHTGHGVTLYYSGISIHAPSRERLEYS